MTTDATVTRLPNRIDRVNAAVSRAFTALHEVRASEWDAGSTRRIESPRADRAAATLTAAVAELQMLALGVEEDQ